MSSRQSKRQSANSIESSVTRLLVSTKHLLESLTQWARKEVDDKFVSDAYVKLGNDFRAASRAFTHAGVDISDIGDVPQALRVILESALSEAPSPENLDRFLPNIRNIIVALLQNLKTKQHKAKGMAQEKLKERERESDKDVQKTRGGEPDKTSGSQSSSPAHSHSRTQSYSNTISKSTHARTHSQTLLSASSAAPQSQLPPNPTAASTSRTSSKSSSPPSSRSTSSPISRSTPQPESLPLPKASKDPITDKEALAQLQNDSFLQRRASKRFSAYQYAKLANINPTSSLPTMPTDRRSTSLRDTLKDTSPSISPNAEKVSQSSDTYVFLRLGNRTRKVSVKTPITFASLRLLFVETFAYSPGTSDFPVINVVDPATNVSYELEDKYMSDITTGIILSLNDVDITPQKSIDPPASPSVDHEKDKVIKDLQDTVSDLRDRINSLDSVIVKTIQDSISSLELPSPIPYPTATSADVRSIQAEGADTTPDKSTQSQEIKDLKRIVGSNTNDIKGEVTSIKNLQAANEDAIKAYIKDVNTKIKSFQERNIEVSKSSNRLYMEKCHSRLSEESDSLLTKVDDLQDLMEALRKDVAQRGVRISPQQLKMTLKDISDADASRKKMADFIKNEKSVWKKIWEAELDKVCEEQQFFNLQDDLTRDLDEDIAKIKETYDLIEQCSLEQSKQSSSRRNKVVANLYIPEPGESLNDIKDAVLNEVAALKPDHESRLEAINRAERMREKNKQLLNMTEFQEELGSFVDDSKFKKSGGFDEIEKQRQLKDMENLKSSLGGI